MRSIPRLYIPVQFFQLVFGLPINMVHGNLRFMLLYQLGVVGGALCYAVVSAASASLALLGCLACGVRHEEPPAPCLRSCAQLGGGHFSLVGASGGVYSIFGMHFAELLLNWDSQKKGFFNHWTRCACGGGEEDGSLWIALRPSKSASLAALLFYVSGLPITSNGCFCAPILSPPHLGMNQGGHPVPCDGTGPVLVLQLAQ